MSSDDHPGALTPDMLQTHVRLVDDDRCEVARRIGAKTCSRCGTVAPTPDAVVASFLYSRTEHRFRSRCRACVSATTIPRKWNGAVARAWQEANRERYLAGKRRYGAKNAERVRQATAEWRRADPERARESIRRSNLKNHEAIIERDRRRYREGDYAARKRLARRDPEVVERERLNRAAWRAANPDKVRQYDRTKRAKRKGAQGPGITTADEQAMWVAQNGRCRWCAVDLATTGYHVDHVVAIALGGHDAPDNGCLACPSCNCRKSDLPLAEWLRRLAEEGYVVR